MPDSSKHALEEQQDAAAQETSRREPSAAHRNAPAAADAAGETAVQLLAQPAGVAATQQPAAAAAAAEPVSVAPDAVPLATDDGLLAIGGFDELLAAPSQLQPPASQGGDVDEGPHVPSDAGAEEDAPNPPVSTEISRAEQEETAAAVADEMEHKDRK